ncbi:AI-2E family transporter [Arthrobacter sp. KK5.5]|uniref:AI-2E family transporter n=1 Tax=Arthrobacter sp. KK5.5 TaxID=3373084 RepID=UPI003EE79EEA
MNRHSEDDGAPAGGAPSGEYNASHVSAPIPAGGSTDPVDQTGPSADPSTPSVVGRLRTALRRSPQRVRFDVPPEPDAEVDPDAALAAGRAALHPIQVGFMGTVGVGLALLGYFILTNVGQLVVWIAVALFIALGLDPVVKWIERRGLPRPAGVIMAMLLLAGVFAAVFGTLIPTIVTQTGQFIERSPGFADDFLNSEFFRTIDDQFQVRDRATEEVNRFFRDSDAVGGVFGGVIGAGTIIAQGLFGTLTVLVLAIYFLASLPSLKAWFYRLAPRSRRARVQELSEQITTSVGNYVIGQAFVAFLNATYAFIVMSALDMPFALLLALVVAMLAFVPLVGAVIAGIVVSLIALTVGWQTAATYAAFYFAYLQVEAYIISPRVMQRAVAVPGAVAVIAVIAGGSLLGIAGALMAIPLAAAAVLLLREVLIDRQDRR